ncbi:MAG: energy-coupling factor transporter transmembrane protein EcfT [Clostridia bacterium]|nr:energy-coupling factor transporter transmembrane protein EcfT [Clostridia bacterium]
MNPITYTTYLISTALLAALSQNPFIYIVSLVGALSAAAVWGHLSRARCAFCGATLFIMTAINPIVSHRGATPLFFVGDTPITLEAILYGASVATVTVACICWFYILSDRLSSDKLTYLLGRLSPRLSLLFSMSLRYVPMFLRHYKQVKNAQKTLGRYGDGSFFQKLRAEALVLDATVAWAIEKGIITSDSMRARGYGSGRRTSFAQYPFTKKDALFTALSLLLTVATALPMALGALDFDFYPTPSSLEMTSPGILCVTAYSVLCILPLVAAFVGFLRERRARRHTRMRTAARVKTVRHTEVKNEIS